MDKIQRQTYNKAYYEANKDKILEKLTTKTQCSLCGRFVSYSNLSKHYTLPICSRIQNRNQYISTRQNI